MKFAPDARARRLAPLLLALAACGPAPAEVPPTAPQPAELPLAALAGDWGPESGRPVLLELHADGSYEAFVFNGMTEDGCATVEGAGTSLGTWVLRDGRVLLLPRDEPPDLALKLAGVSAVPDDGRLVLTAGAETIVLQRSAPAAAPESR